MTAAVVRTALASSLLFALAACGDDGGSPGGGADAGPGADAGDPSGTDAGPDQEPAAFAAIFSNGAVRCEWVGDTSFCPADHNTDLFRVDYDPATGSITEVRLTDNSDGIAPTDGSISASSPDDDHFLALSNDREWVLFSNSLGGVRGIYRTRADGSTLDSAELLSPKNEPAAFLRLSEDGTTIWFLGAGGDLYRMDADGANVENLTQRGDTDIGQVIAILPDESGFVYERGSGHDPDGTDADGELYVFDLASGEMRRLTDNRIDDQLAGLGSDGSIFIRRVDDEDDDGTLDEDYGPNLWVVPADASAAPRRLTDVAGSSLELMAVTPDASRVIYEVRLDATGKKEIFSLPVAGGEPTQLSDSVAGESSFFRLLSRDGKTVLYTSNDRPLDAGGSGDIELYSVPIEGGPSVLLSDFDNEDYFLPDAELPGGLIIYHNSGSELYAVPMTGGDHTLLTIDDPWSDHFEGATPDGHFILFTNLSDDPVYDEDGNVSPESDDDLYATAADGTTAPIQLTDNRVYDDLEAVFLLDAPTTERRASPSLLPVRGIDDAMRTNR